MASNAAALIRQIGKEMGLTPAQIAAMLATAKVESGLNPNAVGDGGTSFGLFQMHVGGAGGPTIQSARRYLDPVTAIRARAKFFRDNNITTGQGAAALQRPADPNGYAAKVNAALKGLGVSLNAPVAGGGLGLSAEPTYDALGEARGRLQSARSRLEEQDTQDEGDGIDLLAGAQRLRARREAMQAALATPAADAPSQAGSVAYSGAHGGDQTYKDILALGSKFGLRIDGSNQTTGGSHTAGSLHYSGHAVDFGDAKNDPAKLRALAAWARKNAPRIREFFYDPLGWYIKDGKIIKGSIGGHGDHVHLAM